MGTPAASVDASVTAASARRGSPRASGERFALPFSLRLGGTAYVLAVIPLAGALCWGVTGKVGFITALSVIATVLGLPGLAAALVAERRVGGERLAWRLWAAAFGLVVVAAWLIRQAVAQPWAVLEPIVPVAVGTSILLIAAANTLVLRSRSGQRTILIDAADTTMVSAAFVVPVALVVGDDIVTSPDAWFVGSMALVAVGAVHGIFVAVTVERQLPAGDRLATNLGLALMLAILADAVGGTVQGLNGFDLPTGPFAALHATCLGLTVLFFLYSPRWPVARARPAAAAGPGAAAARR